MSKKFYWKLFDFYWDFKLNQKNLLEFLILKISYWKIYKKFNFKNFQLKFFYWEYSKKIYWENSKENLMGKFLL
jgi:hypothetical protein